LTPLAILGSLTILVFDFDPGYHVNGYSSWGRYPSSTPARVYTPTAPEYSLGDCSAPRALLLPRGLGRSYGDSCLNNNHTLLDTRTMTEVMNFDEQSGVLRAESGLSLASILELTVPKGWFLPVSPGTKFVTLGGAVANDIHGKNHHRHGTFGCHVRRFALKRSDGSLIECSPEHNCELFKATIAGLGLTGLIIWVEIQLIPIPSPFVNIRYTRFRNLDEFFYVSNSEEQKFEYTVAWVDCTSEGRKLGRGIFMAGSFTEATRRPSASTMSVSFPWDAPHWLLNSYSIRAFNELYYNQQLTRVRESVKHYEPFFYPLDRILHWNRMYGKRGFFQYQVVVPVTDGGRAIKEIFARVAHSKKASFLAVLKSFGSLPSPGMLSFPRPGITLVLDFPNHGDSTLQLLNDLDGVVQTAGGALNPSKDARMPPELFSLSYPRVAEFEKYIDPQFSSSFWRRVRGSGV
jgi:FAD/FMN-containing dehydrogenase